MKQQIVKGISYEIGMSGVMSDELYFRMMATPLAIKVAGSQQRTHALFERNFGSELAKQYCK